MCAAVPLMAGKRGLIMGIANERSLAWGIAKAVAAHGAELAVTYQGEVMEKRVRPLAEELRAALIMSADVTDPASLDALFATIDRALAPARFRRSCDRLLPTGRSSRANTSTPAPPTSRSR